MPSQRRPPPPPPPDGDSMPPPLPNRGGQASRPSLSSSEDAPPPLPSRGTQGGGSGGQRPPTLPTRPPQSPQDEYEEMAPQFPNLPPPVPFKPQVPVPPVPEVPQQPKLPPLPQRDLDAAPDETYELPASHPPNPPTTGPSHRTDHDAGSSTDDGEAWSDSEFDDPGPQNGDESNADSDLYLVPDNCTGGEMMDSTYVAPDTDIGFDPAPIQYVPAPPRPPTSSGGIIPVEPSAPPATAKTSEPLSVSDRMKLFQQKSNTANTGRPPVPSNKPRFNPPTVTKPQTTPRSGIDQSKGGAEPHLQSPTNQPQHGPSSDNVSISSPPKPPSASSKPTSQPKSTNHTIASAATPPRLPSRQNADAPPELPPNHPRRPSATGSCGDDSGSAGSVSGSGGGAAIISVIKELNKVTKNIPGSDIADGGGDIYTDGVSGDEPPHPLSPYPWFHEDATRESGDVRVKRVAQEGAFLVRTSRQNNSFTLMVYFGGNTFNLPISQRRDGKYAIGKEKPDEKRFDSVPDFIDHHLQYNITLSTGGNVKLSKPAPRSR